MIVKNCITIPLVCVLFQSCSVYNYAPVPLKDAVGKGKVKTSDSKKQTRLFDKIILVDSAYYGVHETELSNGKFIPLYIPISKNEKLKFFTEKKMAQKVWIDVGNEKMTKGILYSLNDSSISVSVLSSLWKMSDKKLIELSQKEAKNNQFKIEEFNVSDIRTIKARRIGNVKKGAATGALTGLALGIIVGPEAMEKIAGGVVLGIFGIAVGAIIGSTRFSIPIHGEIANYKAYKSNLTPLINKSTYSYRELKLIPITEGNLTEYYGWKAFVSQNDLSRIGQKEIKLKAKRVETVVASLILIPLAIVLWIGMIHPF